MPKSEAYFPERETMTPTDIKSARQRLGLTQQGLAEALRLGPNGERTVRRWESGDVPITGPASLAIEYMLRDHRPSPASNSHSTP